MKQTNKRSFGQRALAWLLAIVFVLSGMNVTGWSVKAADERELQTVTGADDTSKPVHVVLKKMQDRVAGSEEGGWPEQDITEYKLQIVNGLDTSISDWQLKIKLASAPYWGYGYNGVKNSGNYITIGTYSGKGDDGNQWTNATIKASKDNGDASVAGNEGDTGAGFAIPASALAGAEYTLTYYVGDSTKDAASQEKPSEPVGDDVVSAVAKTTSGSNQYYWEAQFSITNHTDAPITGVQIFIPTSAGVSPTAYNMIAVYDADLGGVVAYYEGTIGAGQTVNTDGDTKIGFSLNGANVSPAYVIAYDCDAPEGTGPAGIDKNLDVEYNYAKALQYSLYLYDANMCGSHVEDRTAFTWRKNCHPEDQTATVKVGGKEYHVNLDSGYHDAGDFVKFNLPQSFAMSSLGIGYYEFKDAFDELGQSEHFKVIMDQFAEYFENCTVLDSSGKVVTYCYQVGEGNSDHGYWGPPENQPNRSQHFYFTEDDARGKKPCTDIVGETAAALAIYATIFADSDATGSAKALKYAKALFAYAESNTKDVSSNSAAAGFYSGSKSDDDMALASIWLYKATGDESYKNKYSSYVGGCSTGWVMSWDDVSAAAYIYGGSAYDANVKTIVDNQKNKTSPQGFSYVDGEWGSARYNTAIQMIALSLDQERKTSNYKDWALGQMNYLIGSNKNKQCYIVGYNANSPKYIHHRAASGYDNVDANKYTPLAHTVYGALAGGPNATDYYNDCANAYQYSEVALDYNSGFVGALAGLYLHVKDNEDYKDEQYLITADSDEADPEVKTYYGESTVAPPVPVTSVLLDKETATLAAGESVTLKATVTPAEAKQTVKWTTSDATIATVTAGKVTAVKPGKVTITVTSTSDATKSASCVVTVTKKTLTEISFPTAIGTAITGSKLSTLELSKTSDANGTFSWEKPDTILTTTTTKANVVYKLSVTAAESYEFAKSVEGVSADQKSVTREIAIGAVGQATPVIKGVPETVSLQSGDAFSKISQTGWKAVVGETTIVGTFTMENGNGDEIVSTDKVTVADTGTITVTFTPESSEYKSVTTTFALNVTKAAVDAPAAKPVVKSKTATSITLDKYTGDTTVDYGYKKAGATTYTWFTKAQFEAKSYTVSDLSEGTYYEFAYRFAADAEHDASAEGPALKVITYLSDTYLVDVSKLDTEGYVDAHNGTIAYDKTTNILILKEKTTYTIVGEKAGLKVVNTADAEGDTLKIVLDDAKVGTIATDCDVTIQISGENTIANGITGTGVTVTIAQATGENAQTGMLSVGGSTAISAGTVVIKSGDVTAVGTTGSAIAADDLVSLNGGNVTVGSGADAYDISVSDKATSKIVIDGAQISSVNGGAASYSKDPVDSEGNVIVWVTVSYLDEDGTALGKPYSVRKGADITLPALPKKLDKKAIGWMLEGATEAIAAETVVEGVATDLTYTATYKAIEKGVSLTAETTEVSLTKGYTTADGTMLVTLKNENTDVSLDKVVVSLDAYDNFTLDGKTSSATVLSLKAGESKSFEVALGTGADAGTYAVTVTATSTELSKTATIQLGATVAKKTASKPAAPEVVSKTATSVTLKLVSGAEYGIASGNTYKWQNSNVFAGLSANTEYKFAIRMLATDDVTASEASDALTVKTLISEEDKFTADISKLTDEEYMSQREDTMKYDAESNTLILTKEGIYTIENSDPSFENGDLNIVTLNNATVILKGVTIGSVKADGDEEDEKIDLTLQVSGDVTIGSNDATSDEEKNESSISAPGKVTIEVLDTDATLSVVGKDNAPAISASDVTISSGDVSVNAGMNSSAIKADIVTIGKDVTSVSLNATGDKPAVDVAGVNNFKNDAADKVTIKNGDKYVPTTKPDDGKDDGGTSGGTSGDSSTTTPGSGTGSGTGTVGGNETKEEEFVPDLVATKLLIQKGKSYTIKTNDPAVQLTKISYVNSKSKKIVKASANGKVKAKKVGTAKLKVTIAYKGETIVKTVNVKVQKNPVVVINKLKQNVSLKKKKKLTIVKPINMQSSFAMKFKTSSNKIATVTKKGVVTAKKKGKATITVTWRDTKYKVVVKVK